jgi:hypothetical protein
MSIEERKKAIENLRESYRKIQPILNLVEKSNLDKQDILLLISELEDLSETYE